MSHRILSPTIKPVPTPAFVRGAASMPCRVASRYAKDVRDYYRRNGLQLSRGRGKS